MVRIATDSEILNPKKDFTRYDTRIRNVKNMTPLLVCTFIELNHIEQHNESSSYEDIAKHVNCSLRSAKNTIKRLKDMNIITVKKRQHDNGANLSNEYTVNDFEDWNVELRDDV